MVSRTTFRALAPALAVGAFTLLAAAPARAQIDLDVRGGVYTDVEEAFVGVGILTPVAGNWFFNPNLEFVFIDPDDLWTLNGDFHYDFAQRGNWTVWAGGGPALVFRDFDRRGRRDDDEETDFGLNFLAGVGMVRGALRPYLQGKILISDETEAVLAVGVRF